MAKNKIQFQKGYSLAAFIADYGTEAQCQQALFQWSGHLVFAVHTVVIPKHTR